MQSSVRTTLMLIAALLVGVLSFAQEKPNHSLAKSKESKMDTAATQILIDKFLVPRKAIQEFKERSGMNRSFIRNLPGFIEETAYERADENGNLLYITVVVWENGDAIKKAKAAVQAEYKKQGFTPTEMMERLHIILDRGIYKKVKA